MQACDVAIKGRFRTTPDGEVYTRIRVAGATACSGGTLIFASPEHRNGHCLPWTTLSGTMSVIPIAEVP